MTKKLILLWAGTLALTSLLSIQAQQPQAAPTSVTTPTVQPRAVTSVTPSPISSDPILAAVQAMKKFKVFQFPANQIPRIDGDTADWSMVPESYVVGTKELWDDSGKHQGIDKKSLDIRVKVAWVKGLNRLYFLYEAYDDYWDFSKSDLHHDIFEIVVDGDQSGGPLIDEQHPNQNIDRWDRYFNYHGVHAQNYHIYTPAEGMDWALAWGSQPWIKDLPYANAAYKYNFKPGESGKLVLEFWITPFDYAGPEGPVRAVESSLKEGKDIGLCWAVIDYDDVNSKGNNGFWNLSREHKMYGQANFLRSFTLMPVEPAFQKKIDAFWTFKVLDMNRRLVAFQDESKGKITQWTWDFGDGTTSTEQYPIHQYKEAGKYIVTLRIKGPDGESKRTKVWDVALR